jgi:uncharacterized delta-60 repeat protein
MGAYSGPEINESGLVLCLDAGNTKSYPGIGTDWFDLSGNGNNGILQNMDGANLDSGSLTFDGSNEFVDLTTTYDPLSAPWTLSSWLYPSISSLSSNFGNQVFGATSDPQSYFYVNNNSFISDFDFDSSGNLYVGSVGLIKDGRTGVLKFNSSYQLDTSFEIDDVYVNLYTDYSLLVSSSGKIYDGQVSINSPSLIRLNTDGSLDSNFNSGGVGFARTDATISKGLIFMWSLAEDSNGKIYAGGTFSSYNGTTSKGIVRLNSDGSIDTGFNSGTGFSDFIVWTIKIDSNGKIYAGGRFTSYNGTTANRIIRLNTDGSIDTNFSTGTGFNNTVAAIFEDSNGKIYVGGQFTSYNGTTANRIIRLNTDGSIDTNFSTGTGFNTTVRSIAEDSNGKIYVGGQFTSYNGTTANRIIRLNTDGSIDTGFNSGTGFDNNAIQIKLDSNGKIIVGGNFTSYNGTSRSKLVLLNSDGSFNTDIMSGFENRGLFINAFRENGFGYASSIVDLYSMGITSERYVSQTTLYSIINDNPLNYVETMSSSGTYSLYINGKLARQSQNISPSGVNFNKIGVGQFSGVRLNGKLSNVSVYNKELSASEVKQNYNALRGRFGL